MTPQRAEPASSSPQAQYRRRRRAELAAYLKPIDGLMVSEHPDCPHGQPEAYDLYGCRCDPCSTSSATGTGRVQARRERGYREAARAVLVEHEFPDDGEGRLDAVVDEAVQLWRAGRGRRRAWPIERMLGRYWDDGARCVRVSVQVVAALTAVNQPSPSGSKTKRRKGVAR